uniref:Uncharacterized protein n=1 Tax=mine drainage metagenome TaxID=410659 RepID=E6PY09_9ZZZZ
MRPARSLLPALLRFYEAVFDRYVSDFRLKRTL